MTFPYPTVSSWFEENGDFPENLEDEEEVVAELDEDWEPCCYNSTRNFGTGDHEWGCPNY